MIDPLEVVLNYLKTNGALAALVGERVAVKQRYGDATAGYWAQGASALTVRLDGGLPDFYGPLQNIRLEVRAYAATQQLAMRIWRELITLSRATERVAVDTTDGVGLLHELLQASGPSLLYDDDLGMDFVLAFFSARVGEERIA